MAYNEWAAKSDGDNNHLKQQLTMQNQLYPLLMEEQRLLETKGVNHPEVLAVKQRIDLARDFLANPSAPWRKTLSKGEEKIANWLSLIRSNYTVTTSNSSLTTWKFRNSF